jgi:predicted nucleic acid-binding protein
MIAVDTNVLVYAHRREAEIHTEAQRRMRGPIVHDARIAALCVAHGVTSLLSRDRDFSLFPELAVIDPFGS